MRVLIAVENEEYAEAQIEFVCRHHWPEKMLFNILHVVEPADLEFMNGNDRLINEISMQRQQRGRELVEMVAGKLRKALNDAVILETVIAGYAKELILDTADEWQADLVVVGSHGRRELTRNMVGSVSQAVLTYARCSVMVVRSPKTAAVGAAG